MIQGIFVHLFPVRLIHNPLHLTGYRIASVFPLIESPQLKLWQLTSRHSGTRFRDKSNMRKTWPPGNQGTGFQKALEALSTQWTSVHHSLVFPISQAQVQPYCEQDLKIYRYLSPWCVRKGEVRHHLCSFHVLFKKAKIWSLLVLLCKSQIYLRLKVVSCATLVSVITKWLIYIDLRSLRSLWHTEQKTFLWRDQNRFVGWFTASCERSNIPEGLKKKKNENPHQNFTINTILSASVLMRWSKINVGLCWGFDKNHVRVLYFDVFIKILTSAYVVVLN